MFTRQKITIEDNTVNNWFKQGCRLISPLFEAHERQAGNHEAAQRSAMLYSLFATCKLHSVNSIQWLTYVFENINDHKINAIEELLPQNYAASLTKK